MVYLYITVKNNLGYFNIFRLSQLHQCDQGMLPNRFLIWKFIEELFISSIS